MNSEYRPNSPLIDVEIPLEMVEEKLEISKSPESNISPFSQKVAKILEQIRPKWLRNNRVIGIELFTNGITNKIFCLDIGDENEKMVFRVFGAKSELIIDRESELITFERLHHFGIGPPVYARFQNGFVCGFLPGDCLDIKSVRDPTIADKICQTLVQMHKIPLDPKHENSPIFRTKCEQWLANLPSQFASTAQLKFDQYFKELDLAKQFSQIQRALDDIQSPLVFSHNDLLIYNILSDENDSGRVHFIDYEYAGPNYQLYDIANHFCEYAGVENWDCANVATEQERRYFLNRYFAHFRGEEQAELEELEMARLLRNVRHFEAASHFFWTLWSIHQAALSAIDFDYMQYGITRHCQFTKLLGELDSDSDKCC